MRGRLTDGEPASHVDKVNKLSSMCNMHFDDFHAGMFSFAVAAENYPFGGATARNGRAADTGRK